MDLIEERVKYVEGSFLRPQSRGPKILVNFCNAHVCSNLQALTSNFGIEASCQFKDMDKAMGSVRFVDLAENLHLVHVIAFDAGHKIDMVSLRRALEIVFCISTAGRYTIHLPKFKGCELLEKMSERYNVRVYVYEN